MNRFGTAGSVMAWVLAGVLALVLSAACALAGDKVTLKDGTVLEGRIDREVQGNIWLVQTIGKLTHTRFIPADEVKSVERDASATTTTNGASAAGAKQEAPKGAAAGGPRRVAVLNMGIPNTIDSSIGDVINSHAWRRVVPMLVEDNVDTVVVRVCSPGGYLLELEPFHDIFMEEFKPRFTMVAWIETAISAGAMTVWPIEDMYFMPKGSMGSCTIWSGDLKHADEVTEESTFARMEKAAEWANRSPFIMRSMMVTEPLSVDIDESTNEVTWRQDDAGEYIVNPRGRILNMTTEVALKTRFARGEAATVEELMQQMGISEYVIAGKKASEFIDRNMRESQAASQQLQETFQKYATAMAAAEGLRGDPRQAGELSMARRMLAELRRYPDINPNFALFNNLTKDWFDQQEEAIRRLAR